MHVSKHQPEDFLVWFGHARHRDVAVDVGGFTCKGVVLTLAPWTPTACGHQRISRFYCRLAIEGIPVQAWRKEAVQDAIGLSCKVDRLERQTTSLSNTFLVYAWVWAWSPDDIPTMNGFSNIDRPVDGRRVPVLPKACPREKGLHGPQYPVLIHLDETLDYSPVSERPPGSSTEWPLCDRFRW